MSNTLFVITYDDGVCGFYTTLERAQYELKEIHDKITDYAFFNYRINIYNLVDTEYKITDMCYKYKFDTFYTSSFVL